MCCAISTLVLAGPRLLDALLWLFWPQFTLAFKSDFLVPLLGVLLLPWTTLMYVLVAPGGVVGWDWLWIGLSLLADIASYASGGYNQRNRIPGYGSGASTGTTPM